MACEILRLLLCGPSRKNLPTPDLIVVIIPGQWFFEDFTILPKGVMESSHNCVHKSIVDFIFLDVEPLQKQLYDFLIV